MIHQLNKLFTFVNNSHSLPPGKYSRPQRCNLNVLFFFKQMGNGNRVVENKVRLIVLKVFFFEEGFEVGYFIFLIQNANNNSK